MGSSARKKRDLEYNFLQPYHHVRKEEPGVQEHILPQMGDEGHRRQRTEHSNGALIFRQERLMGRHGLYAEKSCLRMKGRLTLPGRDLRDGLQRSRYRGRRTASSGPSPT